VTYIWKLLLFLLPTRNVTMNYPTMPDWYMRPLIFQSRKHYHPSVPGVRARFPHNSEAYITKTGVTYVPTTQNP